MRDDKTPRAPKRASAQPPLGAAERAPPLPRDWTSTWLVLATAVVMGFLAALALAVSVSADRLTDSWTGGLETRVTLVIPEQGGDPAAQSAAALRALRDAPGVLEARAVPLEEVAGILAPWLGAEADALDDLPTPRMIDVTLSAAADTAGGQAAVAEIDRRLKAAGLRVEIDDNGAYLAQLRPAASAIQFLSFAMLIVLMAASGLTFALACSTALAAQGPMIDVLRLIGAYDGYIAAIFVRRFQSLAFIGSLIGVLLAAGTLVGVEFWIGGAEDEARLAPMLPRLAPDAGTWVRLALTPLGFALIATAAARLAVAARLRRPEE